MALGLVGRAYRFAKERWRVWKVCVSCVKLQIYLYDGLCRRAISDRVTASWMLHCCKISRNRREELGLSCAMASRKLSDLLISVMNSQQNEPGRSVDPLLYGGGEACH